MTSRPNFGSERELRAWQRECNAAESRMTTRHVVAPLCSIKRADGHVRGAGEVVTVDDFEPVRTPTETIPSWEQLERAVRNGAVLERGRRYIEQ